MADYIEEQKKELLKTFDESIVLVEIMSKMPQYNGRICAITKESGNYPTLEELMLQGLSKDENFSFGVTVKCLDLMEKLETPAEEKKPSIPPENIQFVEENFGCMLTLFLLCIAFIVGCLIW